MINRLSTGKSWYKCFRYEEGRDKPGDVRNVMLVVASLIASVTFQAGVNPPGGVWQDNSSGHVAGRAIYAYQSEVYYVFLIANTLALSASILVIISLTYRFPFHLEIVIATISMIPNSTNQPLFSSPFTPFFTSHLPFLPLLYISFSAEFFFRYCKITGIAARYRRNWPLPVKLRLRSTAIGVTPLHTAIFNNIGFGRSAIFAVTPDESVRFRYVIAAASVPYILQIFIQLFNMVFKNNEKPESENSEKVVLNY
ncbi:hypothetical protein V6Z11_D12G114900 [Gossypium hirsutum]